MRFKKVTPRILLMIGLTYFFAPFSGHAKDLPMHETYSTAKNQSLTVAATRYAYRKLGAATGVPLVLLTHTRGNMDTWDPDLVDSLAQKRPVIAFDYKGTGLTGGKAADSFAEMADDTFAFIKALDINQVDLLGREP